MNNSLERLIDGMIEALRQEVIPHTQGEYARGQVFGVIFLLKNLRLRTAWSPAFLGEQLAALAELASALTVVRDWPSDAPRLPMSAGRDVPMPTEAMRDAGDAAVSALIDWLGTHEGRLSAESARIADTAIDAYISRRLRHEIATSAKPMFAEISLGRENTEAIK